MNKNPAFTMAGLTNAPYDPLHLMILLFYDELHFSFLKWSQAKVMGVSLKTERRRSQCPVFSFRQRLRRAEGLPGMTTEDLPGHERRSAPPALLPLICMVSSGHSSFSVLRETSMTGANTNPFQKAKMLQFI
jgi:hypothetical protein